MLVETKSLAVGYSGKVIIDGIEFTASEGEIVTLIGPNGAGKSTILKTICSQLEALGGAVYIEGNDCTKLGAKELAKKLSVLMTVRADAELMTCLDVVESGRYPYTGRLGILSEEDRQAVKEAMELVSVSHLEGCDFSRISDGQRQRVMLAKAICQQPKVLVLDEPTSFLDISAKLELLAILKMLVREKGIAVIMSLHELDLAQRISDKIICVCDGRADRIGTPEEIFTDELISSLYHITKGSYNGLFGIPELDAPKGEPQIFVIGGGGTGNSVYRQLQRKGIPFAAGVIHENDLDHPTAKALASLLITARPFEPIEDLSYEKALEAMKKCSKVICTVRHFGTLNDKNRLLYEQAQKLGILTDKI